MNLAHKIDQKEHKLQKVRTIRSFCISDFEFEWLTISELLKTNHEKDWFRRTAEDMEIVLDDDFGEGEDKGEEQEKLKLTVRAWKSQLKAMLAKPVMAQGTSGKYLTSGVVRDFAERLMSEASRCCCPSFLHFTFL